jgi:hypothetical protein
MLSLAAIEEAPFLCLISINVALGYLLQLHDLWWNSTSRCVHVPKDIQIPKTNAHIGRQTAKHLIDEHVLFAPRNAPPKLRPDLYIAGAHGLFRFVVPHAA